MDKKPNGMCSTCNKKLYRKPSHWSRGLKAYCDDRCRVGTKAKDLTNQKFGMLVPIKIIGKNKWNTSIWLCQCDCGKTTKGVASNLLSGTKTSCGCRRFGRGKNSPNWKDGKTVTSTGYVRIRDAETGNVLGYEHVVVMEKHLGRKLYKGESVHHKNGIRTDNNISNLELRASNHGRGQDIPDLIVWAKEILRRYDDTGNH